MPRSPRVNPDLSVTLDLVRCMPLHAKQHQFVHGSDRKFKYYLGGVGSGKSHALVCDGITRALSQPGGSGCFFARTGRDLSDVILPLFWQALETLQQNSGLTLLSSWSSQNKTATLTNGHVIYFRPYDQVHKIRGLNLCWAAVDELEYCMGSPVTSLEVITSRVRRGIPRHRSISIASTPAGYQGAVREFLNRIQDGSEMHFLTHSTVFENPWAFDQVPCPDCQGAGTGCERCGGYGEASDYIDSLRMGLSSRQWEQEAMGRVLKSTASVYADYDEARHLIPWRWNRNVPWVLGVDWGTFGSHAYFCAAQVTTSTSVVGGHVLPPGSWIVAKEEKHDSIAPHAFRERIRQFIGKHGAPGWAGSDRAVVSENYWLARLLPSAIVRWGDKPSDYAISNGVGMVQSMLDPHTGPPVLYFSDQLARGSTDVNMGIRGAMIAYQHVIDPQTRLPLVEIRKDGVSDHPQDALRYAIVPFAGETQLHGGRPLPYLAAAALGAKAA